MFEMKGFDKLQKELNEVSKAVESLGGEVATLRFDPDDETSVAAAIRKMEGAIDAKVARYSHNPFVKELASDLKKEYRSEILKQARDAKSRG